MKKQALQAMVKKLNPQIAQIAQIFLVLGVLLVGCGKDAAATPTPIQSEPIATTAPTPTLILEPTAVSSTRAKSPVR